MNVAVKYFLSLAIFVFLVFPACAKTVYIDTFYVSSAIQGTEDAFASDKAVKTGTGRYHFSYETVSMPLGDTMGLTGFSYLADITPYYSMGLGGYGSLLGNYGGFFTGGLENELHYAITDRVSLAGGVFVGGGGGGAVAGQGGGFMFMPYIGFMYDMGNYDIGIQANWVKFPNGKIDSSQVGVMLDVPFRFVYSDKKAVTSNDAVSSEIAAINTDSKDKIGFVREYMAVTAQTYTPNPGITKLKGNAIQGSYSLAGFEIGKYYNDNVFGYIEAGGAAGGGSDGYAEILLGAGYRWNVLQNLGFIARGSLGEGGGGFVPMGGGLLYKLNAGLEYDLDREWFVRGYYGYAAAPTGTLAGSMVAFDAGHNFNVATFDDHALPPASGSAYYLKNWRVRAGNETYLNGNLINKSGFVHQNPIHLLVLKADNMIDGNWYLTGQALAAYGGGSSVGVGGYAVGLVGVGYQTPFLADRFRLYGEALVGAAGGGGLAVGGGVVVQPMAGIIYELNDSYAVQLSGGVLKPAGTAFRANIIEIGINYRFATLNMQ